MTKREVYEALIAAHVSIPEMNDDELIAFFQNEIANLDKRAERSRNASARKREAGDELKEVIKSLLNTDYQTIADIVDQLEGEDITASKVVYRLNTLVQEGYAEKADVQIPATDGAKARVVKAYKLL